MTRPKTSMSTGSIGRKRRPLERRKAWYGRAFVLPWVIGFIPFFLLPLIQTLRYSMSILTASPDGLLLQAVGLHQYVKMFTEDPKFLRELAASLQNVVTETPLILSFSIFFAILLNDRFRGRTFARAILFLPVIVTSGVVIHILKTDTNALYAMAGVQGQSFVQMTAIGDMLQSFGLDYRVTSFISTTMGSIVDLTWKCGVQVLLFLGGLQSVPSSFYEAASVEGATAWEKFWKITFPMLTPILLTGIIYTIVDSFTYYGNNIMLKSIRPAFDNLDYAYASAMSIVYSLMVMVILGIVFLFIGRKVTYIEK